MFTTKDLNEKGQDEIATFTAMASNFTEDSLPYMPNGDEREAFIAKMREAWLLGREAISTKEINRED